jgi:hypothetical protein
MYILNNEKLTLQQLTFEGKILLHFFINVNCCPNPSHNENIKFCVVTEHRLSFFKINPLEKDKIIEISKIKLSVFKNCAYNPIILVLVIEKPDFIYDFYNLASEKFYSKPFEFTLPLKVQRKNALQSFFSFGKKESKSGETEKKPRVRKHNSFHQTQFFIEKMYMQY